MKITVGEIRKVIREAMLDEIDIGDVKKMKSTRGSTHTMNTGEIDGVPSYIKFSEEYLFDESDPSMQILVEYLAYRIYGLYPGVSIPSGIHLVYDKENERVGLATGAVTGKSGLYTVSPKKLGKMLSAGVYVDIFLANWDAIGMDEGNIIVDKDRATRIDPGGSMTFRAQGGRKGEKFSKRAGELETMMDPGFGAGQTFQYADLDKAAAEFLAVPWGAVAKTIKAVDKEITKELKSRKMKGLLDEWKAEVSEISGKLASRYKDVAKNAQMMAAA
jgi:hypothetical protein